MSRKERLQSIEDLVMELAPCTSLRTRNPAMYEFFRDLLQNHPDAERKKVAAIVDISFEAPGCRLGRWNSYRRPPYTPAPLDAHGGPVCRIYYSKTKSDTISWRKCL